MVPSLQRCGTGIVRRNTLQSPALCLIAADVIHKHKVLLRPSLLTAYAKVLGGNASYSSLEPSAAIVPSKGQSHHVTLGHLLHVPDMSCHPGTKYRFAVLPHCSSTPKMNLIGHNHFARWSRRFRTFRQGTDYLRSRLILVRKC